MDQDIVARIYDEAINYFNNNKGGNPWKAGISSESGSTETKGLRYQDNLKTWGGRDSTYLDYYERWNAETQENAIAIEKELCNVPGICNQACPRNGFVGNEDTNWVYIFEVHNDKKNKCGLTV